MKCANCEIAISPAFAKAIMDNQCPACGKEILKDEDFRELLRIRSLLQDLDLGDGVVVSVSAAISQKYDLVPKGSRNAMARLPTEEEIETMSGLNEEEKVRLRALQAAQIERRAEAEAELIKEWGLDHGQIGAGGEISGPIDPNMAALFEGTTALDPDMPAPLPGKKNVTGSQNEQRLMRAEAMRADPGRFKVMRAE